MNLSPTLFRKRLGKGLTALGHPTYRAALRHKVLPAVEHDAVLRLLGPLGTVLDVGANVGQFAVVARRHHPGARIVSFEPIPEAQASLRTLFAGDARFELVPAAVSATAGRATFHLTAADDSSSLLPVTDRQVAEFADTAETGTIEVDVVTLDGVLGARDDLAGPVLLKLDTQGTELAVLQGGAGVLGRVDHVVLEVSFVELYEGQASATELLEHLFAAGFELRGAYDLKRSERTGEPIQADLVCSRRRA